MSTTTKISYGSVQTQTITLASLASGAGRRGLAIDNSTDLFDDVLVQVSVTPGTLGTGANLPYIVVAAYASADGGTVYETQGSSDAAYATLTGSEKILDTIIPATSAVQCTGVFNVAKGYGGIMPAHWGIIVWQLNCGTFSATAGNHFVKHQGIYYTNG